jgi:hypothetical protein
MTSKGRFALVLLGTLAFAACADDEDLKDTRPADGDVSDVIGIDVDDVSSPDADEDTGTIDMDADVDGTAGDTGGATDTGATDTGTSDTSVAMDTDIPADTGMVVTDTGTITTDTGPFDSGTFDTGTAMDSAPLDTGPFDTGTISMDSAPLDTGPFDTGTVMDSAPLDTGPFDTGTVMDSAPLDTGPFDTGTVMDSAPPDTGPFDTGTITTETGAPDTAMSDGPDLETSADETGGALDGTVKTSFSHSVTIDGANDFTAAETFATSSAGYTAYVTWDSAYVYVGYSGTDIGSGATNNKWVFVHLDGVIGGATGSETYNTQRHLFPAGFDSDVYFAWKTDDSYQQLKIWNGTTWVTDSVTPVVVNKSGSYVEMAIPLSTLGARSKLGITTYMLNEQGGVEGTYAALYASPGFDGYSGTASPKTIPHWVDAFSGLTPPNDPSREKP